MAIHHNKRQLTVRKIANYISLPCRWGSTLWMRRQWHCGCHKATNLRQYRQVEGAREGEMCVHVFYRHCHRKAAAGNQRQALGNKRLQNLEKPNWKPLDAWWSGLAVENECSKRRILYLASALLPEWVHLSWLDRSGKRGWRCNARSASFCAFVGCIVCELDPECISRDHHHVADWINWVQKAWNLVVSRPTIWCTRNLAASAALLHWGRSIPSICISR